MSTTPILLTFHNHQPVGNLPWIVEECYRTAYLPFLEMLECYPGMRVGLHYSGSLLEWLAQERPTYLARVRALVASGQVEVLGGGFYEPILPVIPARDRRGQLEMMRAQVTALFGCAPSGAWLAERVWEPCLPAELATAGVEYVLLDDEGFRRQGMDEQALSRSYLTEEEGASVRLLPISRRLRYTLPTKPVPEILDTLHAMAEEGAEVLIYAEDGERYGNWPGTFSYMYGEQGYLDALFAALAADTTLRLTLPGEYVRTEPARGLVYLPPTSYREMLDWSDGYWRNFLTRYPESNLMHKKMLQVSRWVAQAAQAGQAVAEAQRALYAGQCNCAYWYGVFGGIYFPHLRRAVYAHLLRAEALVAPWLDETARPALEQLDFDGDGQQEILLRAGALSAGIAPAQGGALFILEQLDAGHNLLATLRRYPLRALDESELPATPVDWHPRFAFLDHLLAAGDDAEAFREQRYHDLGDFTLGNYQVLSCAADGVVLARDGHCWDGEEFAPLRVQKRYQLHVDRIEVAYTLTNTGDASRALRFAVELNAVLSAGEAPGRTLTALRAVGEETLSLLNPRDLPEVRGVRYADSWLGVTASLTWAPPATLLVVPLSSPISSLEGVEWVYQSTVTLPVWEVSLLPGAVWQLSMTGYITATPVTAAEGRVSG